MRMTFGAFHDVGRLAFLAKRFVSALTLKAGTAGNGPVQYYGVAWLHVACFWSHRSHNSRAFVTHHQRPFPAQRGMVGVANSRSFHRDQHLVTDRFSNLDALKRKLSFAIRDGCLGLHAQSLDGTPRSHNAGIVPL